MSDNENLSTIARLKAGNLKRQITLAKKAIDGWPDDVRLAMGITGSSTKLEAMEHVCKLASELCDAIDAAEEDIGGQRPIREILAELGPACDKVGRP